MNVNEYISSGILESYALGIVTAQEKQEVECMSHIYPEIAEELSKVMSAMEDLSLQQAIQPPAHLKQQFLSAVKQSVSLEPEGKVIPINTNMGPSSLFRMVAAACLVFGVVMSVLYFTNNSTDEINRLQAELTITKGSLSEKEKLIAQLEKESQYSRDELAMFRDPEFKTVFLKGTNSKPQNSLAIVCCNTKKNKTVIAIEDLPKPADDKQYQLWAIVDGKPVDMGVLPADTVGKKFFEVTNIANAQAFAITLEKKGGNPQPTLDEMYVMGAMQ